MGRILQTTTALDYRQQPWVFPETDRLFFWEPSDALYIDGTVMPTLVDQSGGGRDATQATTGKRAIFKTGIVNGHAVARFIATNSQEYATSALLSIPSGITIMSVAKISAPPANSELCGFAQGVNNAFFGTSGTGPTAQDHRTSGSSSFTGSGTTHTFSVPTPFKLWTWVVDGSGDPVIKTQYQNEVVDAVATATPANAWAAISSTLRIGSCGGSLFFDGDLASLQIFNGVLSAARLAYESRRLSNHFALY